MTNVLPLAAAMVAGSLLGLLFFGGLWWTTSKGVVAAHPALWFLGSRILRTGAVMAGFYFITNGDWHRTIACLFGFIAVRLALMPLADILERRAMAATKGHRES